MLISMFFKDEVWLSSLVHRFIKEDQILGTNFALANTSLLLPPGYFDKAVIMIIKKIILRENDLINSYFFSFLFLKTSDSLSSEYLSLLDEDMIVLYKIVVIY